MAIVFGAAVDRRLLLRSRAFEHGSELRHAHKHARTQASTPALPPARPPARTHECTHPTQCRSVNAQRIRIQRTQRRERWGLTAVLGRSPYTACTAIGTAAKIRRGDTPVAKQSGIAAPSLQQPASAPQSAAAPADKEKGDPSHGSGPGPGRAQIQTGTRHTPKGRIWPGPWAGPAPGAGGARIQTSTRSTRVL